MSQNQPIELKPLSLFCHYILIEVSIKKLSFEKDVGLGYLGGKRGWPYYFP